jgi:hypothetical protein
MEWHTMQTAKPKTKNLSGPIHFSFEAQQSYAII